MKVVVTGASGFLGRQVFAELSKRTIDVKGLAFSRGTDGLIQLDLNDPSATKQLLESLSPTVVIHCAAERKPDVCEKTPSVARALNVVATENLAKLSTLLGFTLIYISTDYVFPGNAPEPVGYDVNDAPAPTNLYGETKYEGEKVVLEAKEKNGAKVTVLRVPVLYGPAHSNSESAVNCLYDVVLKAAKKEKAAKMDDWAARYPTNTQDIARVLADLTELSSKKPLPAILQFSAQERFTKFEISQIFARSHSPPLVLDEEEWFVRDSAGPQPGDTIRPKDCHLSNRALKELGINCSTARTFEEWSKDFVKGQAE
ncbi:hypothetical protein JCM3765_004090 [Sporobolomyces pararoseus]